MKMPEFAGIVGGQPNKAFYFVGQVEDQEQLIFLDPHVVQNTVTDIKHSYQE